MSGRIQVLKVSNAVAGATGVVQLPLDAAIERVIMRIKSGGTLLTRANMIAYINKATISLNSKEFRELTAEEIIDLCEFNGSDYAYEDGFLEFDFMRQDRRTAAGEQATFLGTKGLTTAQIELDIDSTAGATFELEAYAIIQPANVETAQLVDYESQLANLAGVGNHDLSLFLNQRADDQLQRLHIWEHTAGDCDYVEFKVDGETIYELDRATNDRLLERAGYVPRAKYFSICFDMDRLLSSRLAMKNANGRLSNLKIKANFQAFGGNPTLISEWVTKPVVS
jgi:hypothetical protein